MNMTVYKIARASEWAIAEKTGVFTGSPDDRRDGFIHFSAAHQVRTTFNKYFARENGALLVSVESDRLEPALKWEVSRGGDKFPHLYGPLPLHLVHAVVAIGRDRDGHPIFPPEVP